MAENSSKTRRNFLKTTAGAAGIAGLAGCNTNGEDEDPDGTETDDSSTTEPDPTYSLQTSALEYDLTNLATSEADQHNQAYVQDNYSAELGVTVLENGEEADLEELSEVHLEDEEGKTVETTEEGYVPEYAVEDGQELTVRAEVNGEELTETVTVSKNLPDNFLVDAQMMEGEETVYETPWSTPYEFDSHETDRQAFLDQRAEKRDEMAVNNVVDRIDQDRIREVWENDIEDSEIEKKKAALALARSSTVGTATWDGIGVGLHNVEEQAANEEVILRNLDIFPDYDEVFIGSFTNPAEPEYDENGNKQIDGVQVQSKVAYIDGDWFHAAGAPNEGPHHIENIKDIEMVDATASSYAANSVLAEFEEGEMDNLDQDMKHVYTGEAIKSPPELSGQLRENSEMIPSFPVSWSALESIRANEDWDSFMPQIELAVDNAVSQEIGEDDVPERFTASVGQSTEDLHLLSVADPSAQTGLLGYNDRLNSEDIEQIKQEFLQ